MTDEYSGPPAQLYEHQKRRFQWYTGYSRDAEYDKNPQWAIEMRSEEGERDEGDYTVPTVCFYCAKEPEDEWMCSDTAYDLTRCL